MDLLEGSSGKHDISMGLESRKRLGWWLCARLRPRESMVV